MSPGGQGLVSPSLQMTEIGHCKADVPRQMSTLRTFSSLLLGLQEARSVPLGTAACSATSPRPRAGDSRLTGSSRHWIRLWEHAPAPELPPWTGATGPPAQGARRGGPRPRGARRAGHAHIAGSRAPRRSRSASRHPRCYLDGVGRKTRRQIFLLRRYEKF